MVGTGLIGADHSIGIQEGFAGASASAVVD
jgi:hypothetical protein